MSEINDRDKIVIKITDVVKEALCLFEYYRVQVMYYSVIYKGEKYLFPIPIEDVGGGTLEGIMKAITLMRWIRKAIEEGTFVKA